MSKRQITFGVMLQGQGLDDFIRHLPPVLQERGYHDPVLRGATLRDHLGLSYRESRYARPAEPAREPVRAAR